MVLAGFLSLSESRGGDGAIEKHYVHTKLRTPERYPVHFELFVVFQIFKTTLKNPEISEIIQ